MKLKTFRIFLSLYFIAHHIVEARGADPPPSPNNTFNRHSTSKIILSNDDKDEEIIEVKEDYYYVHKEKNKNDKDTFLIFSYTINEENRAKLAYPKTIGYLMFNEHYLIFDNPSIIQKCVPCSSIDIFSCKHNVPLMVRIEQFPNKFWYYYSLDPNSGSLKNIKFNSLNIQPNIDKDGLLYYPKPDTSTLYDLYNNISRDLPELFDKICEYHQQTKEASQGHPLHIYITSIQLQPKSEDRKIIEEQYLKSKGLIEKDISNSPPGYVINLNYYSSDTFFGNLHYYTYVVNEKDMSLLKFPNQLVFLTFNNLLMAFDNKAILPAYPIRSIIIFTCRHNNPILITFHFNDGVFSYSLNPLTNKWIDRKIIRLIAYERIDESRVTWYRYDSYEDFINIYNELLQECTLISEMQCRDGRCKQFIFQDKYIRLRVNATITPTPSCASKPILTFKEAHPEQREVYPEEQRAHPEQRGSTLKNKQNFRDRGYPEEQRPTPKSEPIIMPGVYPEEQKMYPEDLEYTLKSEQKIIGKTHPEERRVHPEEHTSTSTTESHFPSSLDDIPPPSYESVVNGNDKTLKPHLQPGTQVPNTLLGGDQMKGSGDRGTFNYTIRPSYNQKFESTSRIKSYSYFVNEQDRNILKCPNRPMLLTFNANLFMFDEGTLLPSDATWSIDIYTSKRNVPILAIFYLNDRFYCYSPELKTLKWNNYRMNKLNHYERVDGNGVIWYTWIANQQYTDVNNKIIEECSTLSQKLRKNNKNAKTTIVEEPVLEIRVKVIHESQGYTRSN